MVVIRRRRNWYLSVFVRELFCASAILRTLCYVVAKVDIKKGHLVTLKSAQPEVLPLTPMSVARADSQRQKNTSLPKADEGPSPISPIAKEHGAKSFNPSIYGDQAALWTPGGVLGISSDGDDRRIFLGLKFSIPGFFGVRKFGLGSLI